MAYGSIYFFNNFIEQLRNILSKINIRVKTNQYRPLILNPVVDNLNLAIQLLESSSPPITAVHKSNKINQ